MSEDIPPVVYREWTLADLDWLHEMVGIGPEWLASDRRAELAAEEPA